MNSGSVIGKVRKFNVCFREEQLTSHARVVLVHGLAERLGVEQIVDAEPQVHDETAERMAPECTPDHQGQSTHAHQQAGYRRAVRLALPVTSTTLALPGESI